MNQRTLLGIVSLLIVVVIAGALIFFRSSGRSSLPSDGSANPAGVSSTASESASSPGVASASSTPASTRAQAPDTFTLAQVEAHNSRTSCYAAIRGSVYDLTDWIYRHPGGPARILAICGTDATSAFAEQHAGEPRPEEILKSFKIGLLAS